MIGKIGLPKLEELHETLKNIDEEFNEGDVQAALNSSVDTRSVVEMVQAIRVRLTSIEHKCQFIETCGYREPAINYSEIVAPKAIE